VVSFFRARCLDASLSKRAGCESLTGAHRAVSYPGRKNLVSVAKLSITVEESDLKWVRREAKRSKQSVSAVVADAIAQKRAVRAQRQYLKAAGPLDEVELRRAMQELG
jgi:hypothetical protein